MYQFKKTWGTISQQKIKLRGLPYRMRTQAKKQQNEKDAGKVDVVRNEKRRKEGDGAREVQSGSLQAHTF